jgi:hypothetical protein
MKKTFGFAALCASILLTTPAFADEAQNLQDFETALAASKYPEAAAAYGRIFEARLPKDGKPKADPTLDALAGRFSLAVGEVIYAQAFLQNPSAGDISNGPARLLATAQALLLSGNYEAALAASVRAVQTLTGEARTQALIGQAQATIMTRPGEVAALIKTLSSSNPALAWRISFLEAQAALIAKDYLTAQKAADRAMLQANAAPLNDYAPMQTVQLQAAVAAAQGLRDRTVALLAAVPSGSVSATQTSGNIANRLPACGVDDVREDDYVIIGMFTQSASIVAIPSPLAASRPEIVAPFMRSIAGFWRSKAGVQIAAYPLMTVRCSGSDTSSFENDGSRFGNAAFVAANHLRPSFIAYEHSLSDDPVTDAAKAFDRIEQSVGADSPILMYPLTEVAEVTASQISENNNNLTLRMMQLYRRAGEAYKKVGGNFTGFELEELLPDPPKYYVRLKSILETGPLEFTYSFALQALNSDNVPAAEKLAIVDIMLKRLGADRADRRVLTMTSRKAMLLRLVGRSAEVESFARATKLDPALCPAKATLPVVTDGGITAKDYPRDAVLAEISGGTVVEIDVDALGKVARVRKLVEAPALVFASALDGASKAIKLDASQDSKGRAMPCKAFRTRIRWDLPTVNETPQSFGEALIGS